jgi:hypothetical protein
MEMKHLTERDDIFVVKNFLTNEECDTLIGKAEKIGFGEAPITGPSGVYLNKSMRNNERIMVDDLDLASDLWKKLEMFVSPIVKGMWKPCGLNERFRYYRYEVDQFFDWHFDGEFHRNEKEVSRLTFMIYLNDGYEGGTTDFNFKIGTIRDSDPVVQAVPEKGMALVFTHNVLHRGAPVKSGKKYVLRSDVMYRHE